MTLQTRLNRLEGSTGGVGPVVLIFVETGETQEQASARWVAERGPIPDAAHVVFVHWAEPDAP